MPDRTRANEQLQSPKQIKLWEKGLDQELVNRLKNEVDPGLSEVASTRSDRRPGQNAFEEMYPEHIKEKSGPFSTKTPRF